MYSVPVSVFAVGSMTCLSDKASSVANKGLLLTCLLIESCKIPDAFCLAATTLVFTAASGREKDDDKDAR